MGSPNQQVLSAIQGLQPNQPAAPQQPYDSAWFDFARDLHPETPDSAYDALREKFFQERVMPDLMQHGYGSEAGRTEFMKRTERPDKSEHPRLHLMGTAAAEAFTSPLAGIAAAFDPGARVDQERIARDTEAARIEALKQGVSTTPYELAGQAIGAAPYFAPLGGVAGAGEKIASFMAKGADLAGASAEEFAPTFAKWLQRGINVSTAATIQGAYDAAKAKTGERTWQGMKGAALGGAFVGGLEMVGGLGSILRSKGFNPEETSAASNVAKGTATPSETAQAAEVAQLPDLAPALEQSLQQAKKAAAEVGTPDPGGSVAESRGGKVKITMRGADGKFYNLFGKGSEGMTVEEFQPIVDRLTEHLNSGGVVRTVRGDPTAVNQFYGMIEDLQSKNGKFDFKLPEQTKPTKNDAAGAPLKMAKKLTPEEKPKGEDQDFDTLLGDAREAGGLERDSTQSPEVKQAAPDFQSDYEQDPLADDLTQSLKQIKLIKERNAGLASGKLKLDKGLIRGNADLPMTEQGHLDTLTTGARLAAKGGLDELHSGPLTRHQETADNLLTVDPSIYRHPPNPDFRSWGKGFLTGQPQEEAIPTINDYIREAPDLPIPGETESFNQARVRTLGAFKQLMDQHVMDPERKIGVVTSSTDIGLLKAWAAKGFPDDLSIDSEVMVQSHENPGEAYRMTPEGIRKVDIDADSDLRGGIYAIRHGETAWNAPKRSNELGPEEHASIFGEPGEGVSYKETPLSHRFSGDIPFLDSEKGDMGASLTPYEGVKPSLFYGPNADKETIFHENMHGHFGYMGMSDTLPDILGGENSTPHDIIRWGGIGDAYADMSYGHQLEEAYVHAASAVRVGNEEKLAAFARADTDLDHVLDWVAESSDKLADLAASKEDSLHKRTLERRLTSVINRAGSQLEDIRRAFTQSGDRVSYEHGRFVVESQGSRRWFNTRAELLDHLEPKQEPLNVPELDDEGLLPDGVPRYARKVEAYSFNRAPITTAPPPPDGKPMGMSLLGRYFRPFYDWIADVSEKQGRSDLWDAFYPIDRATVGMNNFMRDYQETLQSTIGRFGHDRQTDFFSLLAEEPGKRLDAAKEFRFSDEELGAFQDFNEQFLEPLKNELGFDLGDYLRNTLPRLKGVGYDVDAAFPGKSKLGETSIPEPKDHIWKEGLKSGELSPHDSNLYRIAGTYLRMGSREKFLGDLLNKASALVDEKTEEGAYKLGLLRTPLARHIEYLRGAPDYTQKVAESVAGHVLDMVNAGIDRVNEMLPGERKLSNLDMTPREAFSKMILMNYAGELALKPALIVRDLAQLFLTTFPVLGNYTWTGMKKMFPAVGDMFSGGWEGRDIFDIPKQYGALIEKRDWDAVLGEQGAASKFAEKALSFINFSHNVNRVAAFWGHEAMTKDALESFFRHGEAARFVKESGAWFMKGPMRDEFVQEAQGMLRATPEEISDYSRRMAKEMVELTQWNFKRGANPGIYEYQLGRLFGQYGTWPLNYWEYARRFVQGSDKVEASKALTRLVLTHGAVLAAGQSAGVDLSHWVFTQPLAYGGGPALDILTNIPKSMDFSSQRGSEARQELKRAVFPGMLPGGEQVTDLYEAIAGDDPNIWKRIMGFSPLKESK